MNPPPLPSAPLRPRSAFITVLAWFMMIAGGLGVPVSFLFVVIVLGKSYATQNSDPIFCTIMVLGPVVMMVLGFGLLKRWWWARSGVIALLAIAIAGGAWESMKPQRPTTTYMSPSGVPTTVIGSGRNFTSLPVIGVCAALMMKLLSRGVREEFPTGGSATSDTPDGDHRAWRVGHRGRDMMYYEEKIDGQWQHLDISGEMLTGRAHHVIYFESAERWQSNPEWARHRRAEIIARIKSEFRAPDYEYQGDG